jgi:transcription-repair coupling factor (superfamily II helicase)
MDLGERRARMQEFLHLEYADKATLYVPVSQLQLISRYTGVSADEAPLHKLGSGQWEKAKRARPPSRCATAAAELLNIYARRAAREGHAFRYSRTTTRPLPTTSASRKPPTRTPPSTP